jgi:hypothetical protein
MNEVLEQVIINLEGGAIQSVLGRFSGEAGIIARDLTEAECKSVLGAAAGEATALAAKFAKLADDNASAEAEMIQLRAALARLTG